MLSFIITAYKNLLDLVECVASIRSHYPGSSIVIISDGEDTSRYPAGDHITIIKGRRLKVWPNGGAWYQRILKTSLQGDSGRFPYIVKLDPDVRVLRRLVPPYAADDTYAGCLRQPHIFSSGQPMSREPFALGCAVIFKRQAVERVVESGVLLDRRFHTLQYRFPNGLSITDFILHDAAKELGISPRADEQILLDWPKPVPARLWAGRAIVNV